MKESNIITNNDKLIDIIEQSAKVLGGVDRIRDLHTMTLYGYAQYAYMWGNVIKLSLDKLEIEMANIKNIFLNKIPL